MEREGKQMNEEVNFLNIEKLALEENIKELRKKHSAEIADIKKQQSEPLLSYQAEMAAEDGDDEEEDTAATMDGTNQNN
ncbi:hypothetical protein PVK06_027209 [Gossypium arboreum]|uniref:Uncharacterized protein n=1 Tax=Gossypium arboreum TaxID=29729 RepID=A0ABR0NZP2_GOSAR|nr:hypothetical protein PVK06_027209 [Gossypium arboreum]